MSEDRQKYVPLGLNMTLEEIADMMGITRERVRQIEKKALAKMRRRLQAQGLELDDLVGAMTELPQRKAGGIRHDE
jgi:transcriptional regulator